KSLIGRIVDSLDFVFIRFAASGDGDVKISYDGTTAAGPIQNNSSWYNIAAPKWPMPIRIDESTI
ncbi:MAG: hypothetical protein P8X55_09815, partial [Desulfosarcinaceae bacterium]